MPPTDQRTMHRQRRTGAPKTYNEDKLAKQFDIEGRGTGSVIRRIVRSKDSPSSSSTRPAKKQKRRRATTTATQKKRQRDDSGASTGESKKRSKQGAKVYEKRESIPTRHKKTNALVFKDHKEFCPNLSPAEVLRKGSFGGTYFRPIYSSVTCKQYGSKEWTEFPRSWFEGLDIKRQIISRQYRKGMNKYGVKCGGDLDMWEGKGWINATDPYGWFQWYCRFYLGRRSDDDDRQISRWKGVCSKKGRFRNMLIGKIFRAGKRYNDASISPVIRQTLQHWGYELTERDFNAYCRLKKWI